MNDNKKKAEEYIEISKKVHSGEYFSEAKEMYDLDVNDPMTDRYLYIFISIISIAIFIAVFIAFNGLYPLKPSVPFIYSVNDIVEDLPKIKTLRKVDGEDTDSALQRFLIENYVKMREEYQLKFFDRNQSVIETISTKQVFADYEKFIDKNNPLSPIVMYQRHTERSINILSSKWIKNISNKDNLQDYNMQIIYNAKINKIGQEPQFSRWKVDVAFKYEPIKLDTETGNIKPYGFIVTSYNNQPFEGK